MLIGYARVSTIDQNPALQMDALKTAGCDKVFTEKASGSHRDRPQLKAALNYLREGDTLVVWKLSRLARSLTQVIKTATDINDRGIALKVLTQNIDTSTSEGRLFFHMTAAFDEFQRELIVENTRAGLAAANKRGRRGGRPRAMNEQTIKHAEAMLKDTENYGAYNLMLTSCPRTPVPKRASIVHPSAFSQYPRGARYVYAYH